MGDRDAILARIRALLAKTVENGCTEAEAVAAAELAAKLLAKHNLTLDEAELRASPFKTQQQTHRDEVGLRLWKPADAIADLTGTTFWTTPTGVHPVKISFFGFDHEVEIAGYLLEICARAMRGQLAGLERGLALLRAAARQLQIRPFLDGMADRLAERIRALIPPPATGTGLVVVREQLIAEALAERGIQIKTRKATASRAQDPGYHAGRRAADDVALNPGLRNHNHTHAIGRR